MERQLEQSNLLPLIHYLVWWFGLPVCPFCVVLGWHPIPQGALGGYLLSEPIPCHIQLEDVAISTGTLNALKISSRSSEPQGHPP